jgi:hypothetical protein
VANREAAVSPVTAVLDSEALSAVAAPHERAVAAQRAQAVLTAVGRRGGRAVAPAPVLVEVSRTRGRAAAVGRVLGHLPVVDTDRRIAERAGRLLGQHGLDSCHAVNALVVATAASVQPAVVLTGDPDDLGRLAEGSPGVAVLPLA